MGIVRDTQRSRVYAAEDVLSLRRVSRHAQRHLVDTQWFTHDVKVPSVAAVQAYVDSVTSAAWFVRRWGTTRIIVDAGRGSHANVGRRITVSRNHRRSEAVILHEMAHVLAPWYDVADHGPEFAAILLILVEGVMGKEHARDLRASYAEHRVKYRSGLSAVPKPNPTRWTFHQMRLAERKAAKR